MIITDNPKNLKEKLELAKRQIKNAKTREEVLALSNYIYDLDESIAAIDPTYTPKDKLSFLNDKKNEVLDKKFGVHMDKLMRNFLENKEFHNNFFEIIYKKTDHDKKRIKEEDDIEITTLSEDDYYNIFYEFMSKMGLEKYFDRFIKNKRIYTTSKSFDETTLGSTAFNPITKDSDIFVDGLEYDIFSMFTLAHEFGHVYDLNRFDGNINDWNTYFYQSFNGEVVSKTFERLFVDFLIKNNIQVPEAKTLLCDMLDANYEFAKASYIISLIPDRYLLDDSYLELSPAQVYKLVGRYFSKNDKVRKFINKCSSLDIKDTFQYSYGDVISMILSNRIKNSDYNLDALGEFFEFRRKPFETEMLDRLRVTPDRYVKLYKKDTEWLKKHPN